MAFGGVLGPCGSATHGLLDVRLAPTRRSTHQVEDRGQVGRRGRGLRRIDVHGANPGSRSTGDEKVLKAPDYFEPSLARTTSGDFIDAEVLDNDEYCLQCHEDAYQSWSHSAHRFSSFNNGPYAKSLQDTRAFLSARDGNTQASRFCAGCHDPVPFLSGAFDDPRGMIRITRFRKIPPKPPSPARFATPSAM